MDPKRPSVGLLRYAAKPPRTYSRGPMESPANHTRRARHTSDGAFCVAVYTAWNDWREVCASGQLRNWLPFTPTGEEAGEAGLNCCSLGARRKARIRGDLCSRGFSHSV